MIKSEEAQKLREHLTQNGVYISRAKGRSMLPLLRENRDVLVIENVETETELKKGDILLYPGPDGRLTLHRLHSWEGDILNINGDNCAFWEKVKREDIIGRLSSFYHGEKEGSLTNLPYRLYLHIWIYPWQLRFFAKKAYRCLKKLVRRA